MRTDFLQINTVLNLSNNTSFAENIIEKYSLNDEFFFDGVSLTFLNPDTAKEDQPDANNHVEIILKLLLLFNSYEQLKNQMIGNQALFINNLKITLNQEFLKLSLKDKHQQQILYSYYEQIKESNTVEQKQMISSQLNQYISSFFGGREGVDSNKFSIDPLVENNWIQNSTPVLENRISEQNLFIEKKLMRRKEQKAYYSIVRRMIAPNSIIQNSRIEHSRINQSIHWNRISQHGFIQYIKNRKENIQNQITIQNQKTIKNQTTQGLNTDHKDVSNQFYETKLLQKDKLVNAKEQKKISFFTIQRPLQRTSTEVNYSILIRNREIQQDIRELKKTFDILFHKNTDQKELVRFIENQPVFLRVKNQMTEPQEYNDQDLILNYLQQSEEREQREFLQYVWKQRSKEKKWEQEVLLEVIKNESHVHQQKLLQFIEHKQLFGETKVLIQENRQQSQSILQNEQEVLIYYIKQGTKKELEQFLTSFSELENYSRRDQTIQNWNNELSQVLKTSHKQAKIELLMKTNLYEKIHKDITISELDKRLRSCIQLEQYDSQITDFVKEFTSKVSMIKSKDEKIGEQLIEQLTIVKIKATQNKERQLDEKTNQQLESVKEKQFHTPLFISVQSTRTGERVNISSVERARTISAEALFVFIKHATKEQQQELQQYFMEHNIFESTREKMQKEWNSSVRKNIVAKEEFEFYLKNATQQEFIELNKVLKQISTTIQIKNNKEVGISNNHSKLMQGREELLSYLSNIYLQKQKEISSETLLLNQKYQMKHSRLDQAVEQDVINYLVKNQIESMSDLGHDKLYFLMTNQNNQIRRSSQQEIWNSVQRVIYTNVNKEQYTQSVEKYLKQKVISTFLRKKLSEKIARQYVRQYVQRNIHSRRSLRTGELDTLELNEVSHILMQARNEIESKVTRQKVLEEQANTHKEATIHKQVTTHKQASTQMQTMIMQRHQTEINTITKQKNIHLLQRDEQIEQTNRVSNTFTTEEAIHREQQTNINWSEQENTTLNKHFGTRLITDQTEIKYLKKQNKESQEEVSHYKYEIRGIVEKVEDQHKIIKELEKKVEANKKTETLNTGQIADDVMNKLQKQLRLEKMRRGYI